jgi:hypothetical protein
LTAADDDRTDLVFFLAAAVAGETPTTSPTIAREPIQKNDLPFTVLDLTRNI